MKKPFDKILVANRGEIALRVMKTCREMNIPIVAIFSDVDRFSLHTRYANESYHIGPSPSPQSYLNMDKIIEVAKKSGAQAIHPGYGFLAENPAFAKKCEDNGITFIGPSPWTMKNAGDKITARKMAIKAGIPVTPGSDGAVTADDAPAIAEEIGYPVLLKASAGGGGISMSMVEKEEDLLKELEMAVSSSLSSFGSSDIFIEKYLVKPRHIEFQILADTHGNIMHLGERECSVQRRYQKLIEEAPSVIVDEKIRQEIGARSTEIARLCKYVNAGTIEYLYHDGEFYFNEINARLQVEHPVTELVMGVDIVKDQIRIAAGEDLTYVQKDFQPRGWAIECRLNAEDPYNNFLPSPGKVTRYEQPGFVGVRIDSGIVTGSEISTFYDSLCAKINAWGNTREIVVDRMKRVLHDFNIEGIETNIPFHLKVLDNPQFRKGEIDTNFIKNIGIVDTLMKEGLAHRKEMARNAAVIAAAIAMSKEGIEEHLKINKNGNRPQQSSKWKMAGRHEQFARRL
jgi:pyruvate carboxylase subunit A